MSVGSLADNRGVALLVTLAVLAVAVTAALEVNRRARSDAVLAHVSMDRFTLSQIASSGVHLAMALLVKDRQESEVDSLQEGWAGPLADYLADYPFEKGSLEVRITDERAKIQVNALVRFPQGRQVNPLQYRIWTRFAQQLAQAAETPQGVDPLALVHSLTDWLDRGDDDAVTGLTGAESDYYRSLDPPYGCRNGPIPDLGELAAVKGVTPELLRAVGGVDGISRYLTVFGTSPSGPTFDGRININTAPPAVLAAILPETHAHLAQAIADYRSAAADGSYLHSLASVDWYRQVPGCGDLNIDPALIAVSSDVFGIAAAARLGDRRLTIRAVVRREKDSETGRWKCRVLQWREE